MLFKINSVVPATNAFRKRLNRTLGLSAVYISAVVASMAVADPIYAQSRIVDPVIFEQAVKRQMKNRVKGFAFVVANAKGIVAEAAGGWAKAPNDGKLRMTTRVPAGWGSNQKVLSGIALLDLLERRPGRLRQELKTPVRFFVPDRWINAYFKRPFRDALNQITLRDLLDHTSGLPKEKDGGSHGTRIARALSEGNNAIALAKNIFEYNNHNYTLLLYIIANLAYPDAVRQIETKAASMRMHDYNKYVANEYGKLYTRYMSQRFLSRIRVRGTCQPGRIKSGRYAKEYLKRSDNRGDTDNAKGFCRSQGSWFYSARDMAYIHRAIEFTNTFVKRSTRRMFSVNVRGRRMIYWRTFSHPVLRKEAGHKFRGHGGLTRYKSTSVMLRLPFGHVGVGVANSGDMSVEALGKVIMAAFYEATRQKYEQGIDRPGTNIKSFVQLVPDPKVCALACKAHKKCQSWTYVLPGVQHKIGAKCWLKSGTPAPRKSRITISGIKGAEYGRDRPGANFRNFRVGRNDPALCRFLCAADKACKAWTFVPKGGQKTKPRCWLQSRVRSSKRAPGIISGLAD